MTDQNETGFISLKEASQVLRTGEKTVRKWVKEGTLKAYRTPGNRLLFKTEDIQVMVLQSVVPPAVEAFLREVKKDGQA